MKEKKSEKVVVRKVDVFGLFNALRTKGEVRLNDPKISKVVK